MAIKARITAAAQPRAPRTRFGTWLQRPLASFHLIVTIAALLTVLGLVMVLSASSVEAYVSGGSAYTMFSRQLIFAGFGAVLFYLAMRFPIRVIRKLAFPTFMMTVILLVLVLIPGIGQEANGSRSWFVVAGLSFQPAEAAKIAFAIWGAHLLVARRREQAALRELVIPLVPLAALVLALVVLQHDLGMAVSIGIVLMALLWYAGLPLKVFLTIVGTSIGAFFLLALTAGYRSDRIKAFLDPSADPQGTGYQAKQALYSLADGGLFGKGLGQSSAKWNYLPEAHNDFIFAIIGEELGFLGCVIVIGIFGLLAYTGLRIATRSMDPFLKVLAATATTWMVSQAFINIGYVIGILPVTGLQLPLVSAGGTSTATTLFMMGVLANAARHEQDAVAALHSGQDSRFGRLLRLPKPEPYSPTRAEALRTRLAERRSRGHGMMDLPRQQLPTASRQPAARQPGRRQEPQGGPQQRGGRQRGSKPDTKQAPSTQQAPSAQRRTGHRPPIDRERGKYW